MKIVYWRDLNEVEKDNILQRKNTTSNEDVSQTVKSIITEVKRDKDKALKFYTKKFDNIDLDSLVLNIEDIKDIALETVVKDAINIAYANIKRFHELQKPKKIILEEGGINLWKEYNAITKVGLYIPGGTAPLVSTLLMLAIPAQIAGCQEIVACTPMGGKNKEINPAIIHAAQLCGLKQIYTVGGAQAIAAMAYGTESVPKVYKIFGPGNKYVTEAKQQVAQDSNGAAIDMPAGPSEVLIIADSSANPKIVAADLLAQAEHDPESKAILISTEESLANEVLNEIRKQKGELSRKDILEKSLANCYVILVNTVNEAFDVSNLYAPEHLLLQINEPKRYLNKIQNAGSVFIGAWSSESLGDYASGPNHVLPTYGYAKNYSGLSLESFMKSITYQEVNQEGLMKLAPTVEILTELEGLDAHKRSVTIRRELIEGVK